MPTPIEPWVMTDVYEYWRLGPGTAWTPVREGILAGHGEVGERIPDNDRLKAMRQVVRRDPMHTCNVTGARLCYYCGGNQGPDATNPERRDHAHDCPWRRAQEGTT